MTTGLKHVEHRQLRAPREDRAALVDPPMDQVGDLVAANLADRARYDCDLQGRGLLDLSRQARRELVAAARCWTSSYRDVDSRGGDPSAPIFLAGHQPQLFHPGVWFKNFMLDRLARRHQAVAVNLVVDNDTIKSHSLLVPGGAADDPRLATIAMDRDGSQVPYEERRIQDRAMFRGFGCRVARQIAPLVSDPLIRRYWPLVVQRMRATDNLGACLAQARHQLEGQWGAATWEAPVSWLCQTESFAWFVAHLLAHLPRFRDDYNQVVQAYRGANRIRSTAHPAPDLAVEGEWHEAPFWIWTEEDPRRRHLFARRRGDDVILSDRHAQEVELPLPVEGDASRAVARLAELSDRGVKIRSRALITTLWARLVLGDLFLHGIGGAKYDQVTDALIARFFGLHPPGYLVVSATLYLPVEHRRTTADDLRAVDWRLRELTFHPERHVPGESSGTVDSRDDPQALIAQKRQWIATEPTPENARRRFLELRRLNQALQPFVEADRRRLLDQQRQITHALRGEAVLSSREYAFCLFPEDVLRDFFESLLHA